MSIKKKQLVRVMGTSLLSGANRCKNLGDFISIVY
jgi:hypothetical protein